MYIIIILHEEKLAINFFAVLHANFFGYGTGPQTGASSHRSRKVSKKHSSRDGAPPSANAQRAQPEWIQEWREETTHARQMRRSYSVASLRSLGTSDGSSLHGSVTSLVDLIADRVDADAASVAAVSIAGSASTASHRRGVQRSVSRERCLAPPFRRSHSTAVSPGSVRSSAPDFSAAVGEAAAAAAEQQPPPPHESPLRRASTTAAADAISIRSGSSASGWFADRLRGLMSSATSEEHRAKTQSVRARLVSTFKAPYSHGIGESIDRWNSQDRLSSLDQSLGPQQDENLRPGAASSGAQGDNSVQLAAVRRRRPGLAGLGWPMVAAGSASDGTMDAYSAGVGVEAEEGPAFEGLDIVDPNRSALSLTAGSMPGSMSDAAGAFGASSFPGAYDYEFSTANANAYEYYGPFDAADSISFTAGSGFGSSAQWPQQQELVDERVAQAAAADSQQMKRTGSKLSLRGLVHKVSSMSIC